MGRVRGSGPADAGGATEAEVSATVYDLVIVGGGPRAVATIERLDARVRAGGEAPATVAVIDTVEVGAGATWRTDQTRFFLNNTTSDATTIYPDESTPMDGPEADGPTFVEWAAEVAARGEHEVEWAVEEARGVTPGSFPSRRLQGVYYNDQLDRVSSRGGVEVARLLGTVVDVVREDAGAASAANGDALGIGAERRVVRLADGRELRARTVVLAQGMVQALPTQSVQGLADSAERLGLLYIAPGMPAERPWHLVPAGEPVIARGLGANFFDVVAELTEGRGGRFEPVAGDPNGRLRYLPSGEEPIVYATSRRGVPYRSKGDFGDIRVARYVPSIATPEWFDQALSSPRRSIDFAAELWPVIAAEFGLAWVTAVAARNPGALSTGVDEARSRLIHAAEHDVAAAGSREWVGAVPNIDRVLSEIVSDTSARFRIDELRRPTLGEPVTPEEWQRRVRQLVDDELDSLSNPLDSPRQAVNRAMGALRGKVSQLAVRGALTPESEVRDVHGWFNADGLFLASGPPASRVRQVLALIEAGYVRLVGPDTSVRVEEGDDETGGAFRAVSSITGDEVAARSFIETRMSKGKVPSTDDPLLRNLLGRGAARIHALSAGDRLVETESLDTLPRGAADHPLSLVDASGAPDPRVLVLGIPASSTQPGSAIGASPGVPSPLLAGADRAAGVVLALREHDGAGRSEREAAVSATSA